MYSGLGFVSLVATGAGAIMIPPDVAMKMESLPNPLQTFGVDPFSQLVKIPCPGCPFAEFNGNGMSFSKKENYLVANISVGSGSNTLELNGVQIYPPVLSLNVIEPHVLQVAADVSLDEVHSHPVRLATPARSLRLTSWSIQSGLVHTSASSGEDILNLHLQVHAIEQNAVHIPELLVSAVKDKHGDYLLLKAEASDKPMSPQESQKECHNFPVLCKWRAFIADKVEALRTKMHSSGCGKKPGMAKVHHYGKKPHHESHHGKPHHGKPHQGKPHHGKPHHAKPHHHGHMHHHHKMHRFMHKVARVLLTIVIPILVGVLAGMLTYLLGMLIGTGIALLWVRMRRSRGEYAPIALGDDDEIEPRDSFAKGEFIDEEQLESPPVYVEVEEKEIA